MVTRAADYALRATLTLAGLPPGARMCLSELADGCEVPPAYLYKVLQSLARGGMLAAHRGVTGGYELTAAGPELERARCGRGGGRPAAAEYLRAVGGMSSRAGLRGPPGLAPGAGTDARGPRRRAHRRSGRYSAGPRWPAVQGISPKEDGRPMSDTVRYDDQTPRLFFLAAVVWAVVGMLVGVLIAAMLFLPALNLAPYLTFGRLRPLHTNAVIFAFCGNIIFAGTYHSMQRLLKTRLFSDVLSKIHFWGWQLLIVAAALALVDGQHAGQGVRRAALGARHRDRGPVGDLRGQLLRHHRHPPREAPLRRHLVLHRHDRRRRHPPHRQQHGHAVLLARELLGLLRRQGRADAVVVRPQRGGVLPDDAVPRPDVLLPAEGGRPAGVQLPAVDHALLVAGLRLHLGGPAPPPLLGRSRSGPRRSGCSSP